MCDGLEFLYIVVSRAICLLLLLLLVIVVVGVPTTGS